jgi:hypothetical protein
MNWQYPGNDKLTDVGALGRSGTPKRVFSVHLVANGSGAGSIILYNGTSASATATLQLNTSAASKGVTFDAHSGIRFENGCYVGSKTNLGYVTIVYNEEL